MPDPGDHGVPRHGREPGPGPRPGLGAVPVLVRPDGTLLPGVDDQAAWPAGGGDELSWSFRCDLAGALAGLDLPLAGPGDGDQEQLLAALAALDRATAGPGTDADQAAGAGAAGPDAPAGGVAAGPEGSGGDAGSDRVAGGPACADGSGMPGSGVLGRVADALPAGPGLAAWVAQCPAGQLADADLPAAAAALRRVTSWAQAAELAVVAQIAARSAARDPRTGLGQDGCPAAVTRDAAAQAGLALTLSPGAASWWADLAVTLGWRLPGTGAALLAGEIDLARARIIAEATAVLDDQAARAVEDQVLPAAGGQAYGQLRAAVARAVILADPQGAEERRQATERRARVGLYPGDHHTATLTGMNLPAVHAAAAMARLTAIARAMQAAGAGGGLDLLRAHAYLGLLLSTLPPIPPRPDAPPDHDPGPDPGEPDGPGDPGGPGGPGGPGDSGPGDSGPGDLDDGGPGSGRGDGEPGDDSPGSAGRPDAAPPGRTRRRGTSDPGTPPRPGASQTGRRRGTTSQPAPDDSTPDDSTPDDSTPDDSTPDDSTPDDSTPDDSTPDDSTPDDGAPDDGAPDDGAAGDGAAGASASRDRPRAGQPGPGDPEPGSASSRPPDAPPGSPRGSPPGPAGRPRAPDRPDPPRRHPGGPSPGPPGPGDPLDRPDPSGPPGPRGAPGTRPPPGQTESPGAGGAGPAEARSDRLPPGGWPADHDAPADDGIREPPLQVPGGYADDGGYPDYDLHDEPADPSPIPAWPPLPATTPAPGPAPATPPAADPARPPRGLLELTMPWSALARRSASPATLTRIGPVTAGQARLLAAAATPATRWRVILTDTHGHALAVTTIPRHATRPRTPPTPATTLIGRITITMPVTALDAPPPPGGHPLLPAITRAAARTLLRLQHEAGTAQPGTSDAPDPGGCDHHAATTGYRPTTAIRDYITARDQTCRYPCCRQPAWHADLDHTRPWHKGGPTCPCNLGALCRTHHILKQLQGWTLTQPAPGIFQWTTPTGRTYTTEPDIHPA